MGARILVIEDDKTIASTVKLYLEHDGYEVSCAPDGLTGLSQARSASYDLIVLDLMLPQIDGIELCRLLRRESDVYIIMLTARTTEHDKLNGFTAGADDYVTKPFSPRELAARVRAALRRKSGDHKQRDHGIKQFGNLTIDFQGREVCVCGKPVCLTPKEFRLLEVLARSPNRAFTREELIERAFGYDYDAADRTIDAHIMNLRKKIEPDRLQPSFVVTVFGVGYKFSTADNDS
jgi:DNA-binding response OmpR family regulator